MRRRRRLRPVAPCRRCGLLAENPDHSTGVVPVLKQGQWLRTEKVKRLILCQQCLELARRNRRAFWDLGWEERDGTNE